MENKLLIVLVALLLVAVGAVLGVVSKDAPAATPVVVLNKSVDTSALDAKIAAIDAKISSLDEFETEADETLQNDTAKSEVLAEIAGKDFKKAVVALLNDNSIENMSVEDYKDITVYFTKIESTDLGDDSAEVKVTVKVSGFNDGDDEDDFKVKLIAVFNVEGLDVEDLDADASDYSLELKTVYD